MTEQAETREPWHKRTMVRIAALLALLLALLATCQRDEEPSWNALLQHLIEARNSLAIHGETVEEAAARLETVEAITTFMATQMAPAVYPERLYTPQDALTMLMASDADAAVLLHALLNGAGHSATLGESDALEGPPRGWVTGQPLTPAYEALGTYVGANLESTTAIETRLSEAITTVQTAMNAAIDVAQSHSSAGALDAPVSPNSGCPLLGTGQA